MKAKYLVKGLAASALFTVLIIGTAWTQKENDKEGCGRRGVKGKQHSCMNLTEDQKGQMKTLKLEFVKETTPLKNELSIKKAELNAASVGDNVDAKKVNNLIEEIGKLKIEMAQKRFANKQKVRSLLTDEQKVMFDARSGKQGKRGHGKGMAAKGKQGSGKGKQGSKKGMRSNEGGKYSSECTAMQEDEIIG